MTDPAYALPFNKFAENAILIAVTPTMAGGALRMIPCSGESERALELLGDNILEMAPTGQSSDQRSQWVSQRIDRFLGVGFSEDAWFGSLPNNTSVILVKDSAMRAHGADKALRKAHLTAVMDAARSGASIPDIVAGEYEVELKKLAQPSHVLA